MADFSDRASENIPGPVYVDSECADCAGCRDAAPAIFGHNHGSCRSFVQRQPVTEAEWEQVREAAETCPYDAIGLDGDPHQGFANGAELLVHFAALGYVEGVELLLKKGVNPNTVHEDRTALVLACQGPYESKQNEYLAIAEKLLAAGAEVDWRSYWGFTPLMFAARNPHGLPLVKLLVAHGANPKLALARGDTALKQAEYRRYQAIIDFLKPLS